MPVSPTVPHTSQRGLLSDVVRVARGTVIGQAPFVLVTPLIARLYPAAELGVYGLAMAFIGIVGPVCGLRFELAAISSRDRTEAQALLLLSVITAMPVAVISTALLYVLKILRWGSYDALSGWIVFAAGIVIAATGAYSSLRCWLVRRHRFGLVASSLTLQGCARAAIPLLLAPLGAVASLLMVAELSARLSTVALMVRKGALLRALRDTRVSAQSLLSAAQRYWKYPVLLSPSALIDAAAIGLPVPILASCYGLAAAGKFALIQRIMLLPAALITSSVGDVFHAHASRLADQRGHVGQFLAATAARLSLFALVVYVPIALIAPLVAARVLGPEWAGAGTMMAALTPLCIAQTIVSPMSRGLLLSGREERKLLADLLCLVLPLTTLYVARRWELLVAIIAFSIAAVIANGLYYLIIVGSLRAGAAATPEERQS